MLVSQSVVNSAFISQSALAASSNIVTGVNLPYQSGTRFLHELLSHTAQESQFTDSFKDIDFPQSRENFSKTYRHDVMRFEGARASSPERSLIAAYVTALSQDRMVYVDDTGNPMSLTDYMRGTADPLETETIDLGRGTMMPRIAYRETTHSGNDIRALASDFADRNMGTQAATDALHWIIENSRDSEGRINLRGKKFVIMGASAELAPTQLLLEAGADVLWLNRSRPDEFLSQPGLSGTITFATEGADLQNQPREIAETIEKFANGGSVHIGAFAYRAGSGLESRVTAAMNAIVRRLKPETVGSFSTFISPTAPIVTETEDLERAALGVPVDHMMLEGARRFGRFGLLPRLKPNHHPFGELHIADTIVPLQKTGYQEAQYVEKILAAESFAIFGNRGLPEEANPLVVSATVAGISKTQNMQIPTFQLAFLGAPAFGIETFEPETTRWLSGLIMLSDLLNPDSPAANTRLDPDTRARNLFSRQVHGGIYAYPYALNEIIRLAGYIGAKRDWRLASRAAGEFWKNRGNKKR